MRFLLFTSLASALLFCGCSTQVPLGTSGSQCDDDNQCDKSQQLVCRCVRRKSPDDEGPDQIISPGVCQTAAYHCPTDGGTETGGTDTGASDTSSDGSADATTDGGADGGDASDGGADATDATAAD